MTDRLAVVHRCSECRQPVISWTWPTLPPFDGSTKEHTSEPPTLEPCGHVAFTYTTGESMTYPNANPCPTCDGRGWLAGTGQRPCPACNGKGVI